MKRNTIFYEFYKDTRFVSMGMKTLGDTKIATGIDTVPTMNLKIPLEYLPENDMAAYNIKVHIQVGGVEKYVFWGVVDSMQVDYANYSVDLSLSHRISRMRDWAMPVNYTVKNATVAHIIGPNGINLGDPGTVAYKQEEKQYDYKVEFQVNDNPTIEHTFSSTDKLSALQEIVEATEDLHWYVDLAQGNRVVIGKLGNKTDVEISAYPVYNDECEPLDLNKRYVTMLTEPVYNVSYTDHYNRAIVFCGDIGDGVEHLTLKEIHDNAHLQEKDFPVGMYDKEINLLPEPEYNDKGKVINNEQVYKDYDVVAFANNTSREYYVTDSKQLLEDGGIVRNTVFQYSQLYPIPKMSETDKDGNTIEYGIMDSDRIEMAKRAYYKAIRELKAQRPQHAYQFNCTALPVERGVVDGCKVNFQYSKTITRYNGDEDCEETKTDKIVNIADDLYLVNRIITFDEVLNEYTTVTLEKDLRVRAIDAVEWELSEVVSDSTSKPSKINSSGKLNITHTQDWLPDDWDDKGRFPVNNVSG